MGKLRLREVKPPAWGYRVRRGEPGLKLGGPQATVKNPNLVEGTPWGSGMSWGECGVNPGLKWPLWSGLEGKVLDTSRITKAPPVLGAGFRQGWQALGRCWALSGAGRGGLVPREANLGPAESPGPGSL